VNDQAAAHLALAREMVEDARDAVERNRLRTAADRSYYAMLHAASALLVTEGIEARSHRRLLAAFGERFAKTRRLDPAHHRNLMDAFERRSLADYDPTAEFDHDDITSAVDAAEAFIQAAVDFIETEGA
jgi:Uncharacterized conserved protein related to C-terminal domain of eukaryotic chaperone, SACSIN